MVAQTSARLREIPAQDSSDLMQAYALCEQGLRIDDPDRWLAIQFAPASHRPGLCALHAFSFDVARVREIVSDPMPGEVRHQWWREVLSGSRDGEAASHPIAACLLDTIERYHLPRQPLIDLIDARTFDLYDDPMPTLLDLEGYCGETSSVLIRLSSLMLADGQEPGSAEAAGHAGLAYAITGLLRAFPWHCARGQLYIPKAILERNGTSRDAVVAGQGGVGLRVSLCEMRATAREHLEKTRSLASGIDPRIAPAFLHVALVEPYLQHMETDRYDPYISRIDWPRWKKTWRLWRQWRYATRSCRAR